MSAAAINALLARAKAALVMEHPESSGGNIDYWIGYAKALTDLRDGVGDKLAAKDAASGGYTQSCDQAAWARLTIGLEALTAAQIVERFAAEGIEMTTDAATKLRLEAVQQLPHGVVAPIHLDDEHTASRVDMGDGAGLHASIVAQGGAA